MRAQRPVLSGIGSGLVDSDASLRAEEKEWAWNPVNPGSPGKSYSSSMFLVAVFIKAN